jgi:activator of HSP90 ATPase
MDGDVDVSQRKGKVITLFDVRLQLEYTGVTAEGKDVSGTITIPEAAHDTDEDEYVFEITLYSDGNSKQPVKDLVRKNIVPQLRKKLSELGPAVIAEHGKDLQHPPNSNPSSGAVTPARVSSTTTASSAGHKQSGSMPTTSQSSDKGQLVNVTTVTDTEEFRTTAAELYQTFTDPQRIAAFTRSPPKVFEGAKKGAKFELFGGNVAGEFVDLQEPTTIVQRWRLTQWPSGHFSTLRIDFDQNDQDGVTDMRVNWDGVPIGQEEVTKRNWGEYYVRSIKTTFGFGAVL